MIAAVIATGTLAARTDATIGEKSGTIRGVIGCAHCAANHTFRVRKGPNQDANCIRVCMWQGSRYVLAKDGDVYLLKGNLVNIDKFLGERVIVTGTISAHEGRKELSITSMR